MSRGQVDGPATRVGHFRLRPAWERREKEASVPLHPACPQTSTHAPSHAAEARGNTPSTQQAHRNLLKQKNKRAGLQHSDRACCLVRPSPPYLGCWFRTLLHRLLLVVLEVKLPNAHHWLVSFALLLFCLLPTIPPPAARILWLFVSSPCNHCLLSRCEKILHAKIQP